LPNINLADFEASRALLLQTSARAATAPSDDGVVVARIRSSARAVMHREVATLMPGKKLMFGTADLREGIKAFIDKREPQFHGE
jgi:hypothetical protein